MFRSLPENVSDDVKALIQLVSNFKPGTDAFEEIYKRFESKLTASDSMYFLSKRDVDRLVQGMQEKFRFHGFLREAEMLGKAYLEYVPSDLTKSEQMSRLNVTKFLLCMSETPTKKLLENPQPVETKIDRVEEDIIDWAGYLNEGIDVWSPDDDDISTDEDFEECMDTEITKSDSSQVSPLLTIRSIENVLVMDLLTSRRQLMESVQHSWFNSDHFVDVPTSNHREANIGILWEQHLKELTQGLVTPQNTTVITEYKVIREILWQMQFLHTSVTFELCRDSVRPRKYVTLASVRQPAFYSSVYRFIPDIELLEYFRDFKKTLGTLYQGNTPVPNTYRCYNSALNAIIEPVYKQLVQLEDTVRKQEVTYTILRLSFDLETIMKPLRRLFDVHRDLIIDFNKETPLKCASALICRIHKSLHLSVDKLDQDLRTALFLGSCRYYLSVVERWLMKDEFYDHTGEFVLEWSGDERSYRVRDGIDPDCLEDSFLRLLCEKVLQIGKNVHFLRLLGKYKTIDKREETIYDEFVRRVLKKLRHYSGVAEDKDSNPIKTETSSIFAREWENQVDVSNGFLMAAFEDFFEPERKSVVEKPSLYQETSEITTNLYRKTDCFETILSDLLEERFTTSRLLIKNVLIEEHLLDKHFRFLRHLYLFWDDIIFPFYRGLFSMTESSNKSWVKDIWLTSHLQDIFMDAYPEFYHKCSVQVHEGWSFCTDSSAICSFVNVNFDISWPLNIIITDRQIALYREVFQFLLQLKWALYTVNHLMLGDLKSARKSAAAKLRHLKFCLVNILNSLQHFVFGFVFGKSLMTFELDFEKASDLESIIQSHDTFITTLYGTVVKIRHRMIDKDKLNNVLSCVNMLKAMWNDPSQATVPKIQECKMIYEKFFKGVSSIVFPVYIYDY